MTDHREDDILLPGFFMDAGGAEMNGKRRIARGIIRGRGWLTAGLLLLAVLCVFTIGRTRINYDLTRYLDRNTMTRRALDVMAEEFGSPEQLRIMFTRLHILENASCCDAERAYKVFFLDDTAIALNICSGRECVGDLRKIAASFRRCLEDMPSVSLVKNCDSVDRLPRREELEDYLEDVLVLRLVEVIGSDVFEYL